MDPDDRTTRRRSGRVLEKARATGDTQRESPVTTSSRVPSSTKVQSTSKSGRSRNSQSRTSPQPLQPQQRRPSTTPSAPASTPKRRKTETQRASAQTLPDLPLPSLPRRPHSLHSLPASVLARMTPHERVRRLLHVGATPESLPCRDEQFQAVVDCTSDVLRAGAGGCAYICGVPGTGKTATVREAVRTLQAMQERGHLPSFTFVEINGMKLASPMQAYTELWCAISGDRHRLHPRAALTRLSSHFHAPAPAGRQPTVVLMDELDLFVTSRQDVIYNMFHWPDMPGSQLLVLAVANTMDLPERTLQPKVASRLGMTRIPFMPYTNRQLLDIVRARLNVDESGNRCSDAPATLGCESVFKMDALVFASKRVANVSGDARRMLDVCRRAVEAAEERAAAHHTTPSPITIHEIRDVMDRMARSGRAAHIAALSLHAKLLLASMYACMRRTGVSEVVWGDILTHHQALCRTHAHAECNEHELLRPLATLCQLGLVIAVGSGAGHARGGVFSRFLLAVQEDEVYGALGDDAELQALFALRSST